ncbi:hypothetical protein MNBD_GAMMA18-916 [hydrothermal vent metagenome]|uniref:Type 4 fimbrial biogenesis protein PilX N-terminal domain-containing protein n=1 Tax=hydrothermal vent metagenome TaxID=652676 RepID=A0A3B0ZCN2_9ZZZZ
MLSEYEHLQDLGINKETAMDRQMYRITHTKQQGIATLMTSLILLFSITMISLFSARINIVETQIAANDYRSKIAYEAAQGGLEAALASLQLVENRRFFHDNSGVKGADGFIDSADISQPSVTLANGARYHLSYANPIQNDTSLIVVTVTGYSDDNMGIRTVTQTVQLLPLPINIPRSGLLVGGNEINMINSRNITQKVCDSGSVDPPEYNGIQSKYRLSDGLTDPDTLFEKSFNTRKAALKNRANIINCSNCSASHFTGMEGGVAWIEGDVRITGNGTIGTADKPILIIVNGNLTMAGNNTYNGLIYATGNHEIEGGTSRVNGAVLVEKLFFAKGALCIDYNPDILNNVGKAVGSIGKVAGSWRDF